MPSEVGRNGVDPLTPPGNAVSGTFPLSELLLLMIDFINELLKLMRPTSFTGCNIGPQISGGMKFVTVNEGCSSLMNFQIVSSATFLPTQ